MAYEFAQFLSDLKLSPGEASTPDRIDEFENATGLRLIDSLRDIYLLTDGVVLKKEQFEFLSLARVKQFILGDETYAPLSEYGVSGQLGYFPLTETFDSDPVCICSSELMEGYVVLVLHDDAPVLLFRNLESFLRAIAAKIQNDGWDWSLRELDSDFEREARTDRDLMVGRSLLKRVVGTPEERQTELLSFALRLLRDESISFLNECSRVLMSAGIRSSITESKSGFYIVLDDGPLQLDCDSLFQEKLEDQSPAGEQRFHDYLVNLATERLAAVKQAKARVAVVLKHVGDNKMEVLKAVRSVTSLGPKEAKDLLDSPPKTILDNLRTEEAEKVRTLLEKAGAKVEIR